MPFRLTGCGASRCAATEVRGGARVFGGAREEEQQALVGSHGDASKAGNWGLGPGVQGAGCRVQDAGCRVQDAGLRPASASGPVFSLQKSLLRSAPFLPRSRTHSHILTILGTSPPTALQPHPQFCTLALDISHSSTGHLDAISSPTPARLGSTVQHPGVCAFTGIRSYLTQCIKQMVLESQLPHEIVN